MNCKTCILLDYLSFSFVLVLRSSQMVLAPRSREATPYASSRSSFSVAVSRSNSLCVNAICYFIIL